MSAIDDVIKQIEKEKAGIQKHIDVIEKVLDDEKDEGKKSDLYMAHSAKLAKFYSLLQKSSEQMIDALKVDPEGKGNDDFD